MHLLEADLPHVCEHLVLRLVRSGATREPRANAFTELFELRHGIGLFGSLGDGIQSILHKWRSRLPPRVTAKHRKCYYQESGECPHINCRSDSW
jgi:hypothetical protein